ncbi:phage tail sheath C-terminal domain-containing protein, partial [Balneolaceae bacterium ANBcel3]|nr:phage tail sheath C-terminal domain-containing protein [Balneolaceae bacterium ANBcel3]
MASTYKTPGVYVEEISLFPPSIAQVETAIPAFIGYTEKAKEKRAGDLHMKPVRLRSLAEYREKFGGAPPVNVQSVNLSGDHSIMDFSLKDDYVLYDSLRLFFNNGGGDFFVVSIGDYHSTPSKNDFLAAIKVLEKQEEPTLFVIPEATFLSAQDLGDIQKEALAQAADLMDRFVICDVKEKDGLDEDVKQFRKQIGSRNLMYGAAYYPYLHANLGRSIRYRDIKDKVKKYASPFDWKDLADADDEELKDSLKKLNNVVDSGKHLSQKISTYKLSKDVNTLEELYEKEKAAFFSDISEGKANASIKSKFSSMLDTVYQLANRFLDKPLATEWEKDDNPLFVFGKKLTGGQLEAEMKKLVMLDNSANEKVHSDFPRHNHGGLTWEFKDWDQIFNQTDKSDSLYPSEDKKENMIAVEPVVTSVFYSIVEGIREILAEAEILEKQFEQVVVMGLPALKNVLQTLSKDTSLLPPGAAIAGIYSDVDRRRGVWKAPANVSLNSVVGLSQTIDAKDQASMNIDTTAGKSVNAIRAFTGQGNMVWGARTLAGNDNEWRYISVRRLFNMIEESVKKSTYWAVFEPNSANTWVKVQAMIENYLNQLWRAGALAGSTPDEAFFVKVGLGLTMTNQDILEGRMNVEIGLAAV